MSDLTADEVQRIIKDEWLTATANWYGPTGRSDRSAWIDRDGDEWVVWEADERAVHYNFSRYGSEAEALDHFLKLARGYKRGDSTAVRRI
ncbi:hypothetical protein AB0O87_13080 [Microbacterium sp. NPDC076768]|uniref:hypothetical protein n=1 Tax=Microbacterium sp. NPDC076768 TaxID=3154858 RepID=UPI003432F486